MRKMILLFGILLLILPWIAYAQVQPIVNIGHSTGWINDITIDSGGQYTATCCKDQTIMIRDLKTGKLIKILSGAKGEIRTLIFHPNGKYVIAGSGENPPILVWDLESGELIRKFNPERNSAVALAMDPDGKYLAAGGYIWEFETGAIIQKLDMKVGTVWSLAFDKTGKSIIAGGYGINVFSVNTGKLIRNFFERKFAKIISIDHQNETLIATVSESGIYQMDLKTGDQLHFIPDDSETAYSPNKNIVVYGRYPIIYDLSLKKELCKIDYETIGHMAIDPEGDILVSTDDGAFCLKDGSQLYSSPNCNKETNSMVYDSRQNVLVCASNIKDWNGYRRVEVLDLDSGLLKNAIHFNEVGSLQSLMIGANVLPDGKRVVSVFDKGKITLWNLENGEPIITSYLREENAYMNGSSMTSDGNCLFMYGDWWLASWKIGQDNQLSLISRVNIEETYWKTADLTSSGNFVVTGNRQNHKKYDEVVTLWKFPSLKKSKTLKVNAQGWDPHPLDLEVDEKETYIIAACEDYKIRVWDFKSKKLIVTLSSNIDGLVTSVTIDPQARYFAAGGKEDGNIRILSLPYGDLIRTLEGPADKIKNMVFVNNGEILLASGELHPDITVWRVNDGKHLATLYWFADASVTMTPEGYFAGTGNYRDYVHFVKGMKVYQNQELYDHYDRPDLMGDVLAGKDMPYMWAPDVE
ncbi:WD40 repeat domain-containing protein [bacterium]|nr:WD40 repeat domain-containing protein [bacterium]